MKIDNFRGDLTDISAAKEALHAMHRIMGMSGKVGYNAPRDGFKYSVQTRTRTFESTGTREMSPLHTSYYPAQCFLFQN